MTFTSADRAVLADLCPIDGRALDSLLFEQAVEAWYANDHYDDNSAYDYANESDAHA